MKDSADSEDEQASIGRHMMMRRLGRNREKRPTTIRLVMCPAELRMAAIWAMTQFGAERKAAQVPPPTTSRTNFRGGWRARDFEGGS